MRNGCKRSVIRGCTLWTLCGLLVTTGLGRSPSALGQVINREYELKAVFLYKFGTYITWPKDRFADADAPFVIGVLGPDPVGAHLKKIAQIKTVGGRRIHVRGFRDERGVDGCHILFVSRGVDDKSQRAAIERFRGRGILFVGEIPDFLEIGGVINFVIQENRIRLFISESACRREKLEVSAQLLRICTIAP